MNRIVEFIRGFAERMAEEIVPAAHGRALLVPSLPRVFYANHFSVDPGAKVSAAEIVEELEPTFTAAGLAHRSVSIDDGLGGEVASQFARLGWQVEELLVMPHDGPTPDVDISAVTEVGWRDLEPYWAAGMRSSPEITDEDEVRQLVAGQVRRQVAVDVRYFAARQDGEITSYCELFSDGKTGQIESVMTLEPFRNRGFAKAVVVRALAESRSAGNDLTFLMAEAADWPKELYRKLGFETEFSVWDFLLRPPS